MAWTGRLRNGLSQTEYSKDVCNAEYTRITVTFKSHGVACEGWLYLPNQPGSGGDGGRAVRPPVVLMAHGMGAQKDMGLDRYAEAFARGGLAAFVFDYRTFGGSGGEPRQWVSPSRHVEDWMAAIAFVRAELDSKVDVQRMCLWGTSFAGGHVLAVAQQTPGITAIISQVPHLDAKAAKAMSIQKRGLAKSIFMAVLGTLDLLRTTIGLTPVYLPLVGPPGSLAFMQLTEFQTREYFSKHPPSYQGGWQNLCRAILAHELFYHSYSPIKCVPDITCPILFVAATEDELCPVDQVHRALGMAQQGRLLSRECTHFELYRGQLFEGLIAEQVEFLQQQTGLAAAPAAAAADGGSSSGKAAAAAAAGSKVAAAGSKVAAAGSGDTAPNRDQVKAP